jgi:hypothetical protein
VGQVRVEEHVAATPETLYGLVSDVTRMGDWSPETTSCRWVRGATGPAVGAKFRGANRDGWRHWSTTCTVVTADPGKRFAFEVDFAGLPIARWIYDFTAEGDGCLVVETWDDRRAGWVAGPSKVLMGVPDREAHNREGMEATLERLRQVAEAR